MNLQGSCLTRMLPPREHPASNPMPCRHLPARPPSQPGCALRLIGESKKCNTVSWGGCSANCTLEAGWNCDDMGCHRVACGDAVTECSGDGAGNCNCEECDDGNKNPGDSRNIWQQAGVDQPYRFLPEPPTASFYAPSTSPCSPDRSATRLQCDLSTPGVTAYWWHRTTRVTRP